MDYSKGEWVASLSDNELEYDVMCGDRYIAVACDEPGGGGTAEGNAQLIAAAPDLLEALQAALKTAESERHPFRPWHHHAKAAIAKATTGE